MSSIVPKIPDGGPSGGTSITTGPALRSTKLRKYTVSQFPVRNSDAESISSENSKTELSSTPIDRNPWRMAASDAPGKALMNACIPCTKSRWSYSSSAVAFVGAPSRNSSVPRRLSTRSGVEIDRSVSADTPPCPLPLIASSVIVVCCYQDWWRCRAPRK